MIKVEIIGNVGRNPEMRYTPAGHVVTDFSVASNRKYTNSAGEEVKETIWFKCSAFGKPAEILNQYVHKGDKIFVSGTITADKETHSPRIWTGDDGTPHASFEMVIREFEFLTSKHEESGPTDDDAAAAGIKPNIPTDQPASPSESTGAPLTDDVPF